MYLNMSIWTVSTEEEFIKMHENLAEAFKQEYKFDYNERNNPYNKFNDSSKTVINKLLDYFNDKCFFVFEQNDENHLQLIMLQEKKIINFGIDINSIEPNKIYVLEMDKTTDLAAYDTV